MSSGKSSSVKLIRLGRSLSIAVIFALVFSTVLVLVRDVGHSSAVWRGDFPAFYSLGVIAASDQPERLYDLELQKQVQKQAWPSLGDSFLVAAYPPSTAWILQPLSWFSGPHAKLACLVLAVLSLLFSAYLLCRRFQVLAGQFPQTLAVLLSYAPLFMAAFGGQTTPFFVAIVLSVERLIARAREEASPKRGMYLFFAGVIACATLFKPQLSLMLCLGLLAAPSWQILGGFVLGAVCQYLMAARVQGWQWLDTWTSQLSFFARQNVQLNLHQQTSLAAFGLTSCLLVALVFAFFLFLKFRRAENYQSVFQRWYWLCVAAIPLVSPQASFYELGLSFTALLVLLLDGIKKLPNWLTVKSVMLGLFVHHALVAVLVAERESLLEYHIHFAFVLIAIFYFTVAALLVNVKSTET